MKFLKHNHKVLFLQVLAIAWLIAIVQALGQDATIWTTDSDGVAKSDFAPGDIVYINGAGFIGNSDIDISVLRPDGILEICNISSCNTRFLGGLQSTDPEGSFVYAYDLNGIAGEYLVYASDGINSAEKTFTDAAVFNLRIIQPANGSFVLGSVRVRGKWNVTANPPGQLTQYNVQIVWGDGTVNNTININRSSSGTNPNEIFFGDFDTEPISSCVGGNDNCNISNFNYTYSNCGPFNLTAKLYHVNPPGQDSGDASATSTINPGVTEGCNNQKDDDCDTFVDCADSDCNGDPACQICGNGIVETGEQCDDSNQNNNDLCSISCTLTVCGDSFTQSPNGVGLGGPLNNGFEDCDDGNTQSGDGCDSQCTIEFCGDGIIQIGLGEQCEFNIDCDDQNPFTVDTCSQCACSNFNPVVCGDGDIDSGEQCDDGNSNNGDGCDSNCIIEFCGDAIVQIGLGEQCDGNNLNGQSCQSLGHVPGDLDCDANCDFDASGCLLELEPTKDSKVAKAQPTANFGSGRYMMVNDKQWGTDRSYLGFDLTSSGLSSVSDAELEVYVYQTGNQVVGSIIEAWYCFNLDFNELTINWNNQFAKWKTNGVLLSGNCTLADGYTVVNKVISGLPETKHTWDLTAEVNQALSSNKKFSVVIKHDTEDKSNNFRYVQYLTREYPDSNYRPHLVMS